MECKYCQMELADGIRHAWLRKKSARKQFPDEGLLSWRSKRSCSGSCSN